ITDRHVVYAQQIAANYKAAGIRIEVDDSGERMNKKIRQAQLQKVPYMFVVGDNETESGTISVRTRLNENGGMLNADAFKEKMLDLIRERGMVL
ncbi:MAG: threonine--tRNA ligase, partial [Anaerolineae bacterium]|nr:threonine--tRNA ligase [Anaerolineae bacterium]